MKNAQRGFTYIELVITMTIIALALLGALYATHKIQRAGENAFERSVAFQHMNQVLERMRDLQETGLSQITTSFPSGTVSSAFYSAVSSEVLRNESITVSYVNVNGNPLDVTLTNSWLTSGNRTASASLRTLLAKR